MLHGLFFEAQGKRTTPLGFGQHRAMQGRQKDLEGEVEEKKEKKKSPYILWQAEMMLLRLFITVSTSRIVEALKQKSKRKRFGLCLLCCCYCFWFVCFSGLLHRRLHKCPFAAD